MKPGQQFKIDSIEELKEAYNKLSPWEYSLNKEIHDFNVNEFYWLIRYEEGIGLYLLEDDKIETIPNPFKKSKWQRINDILEDPECEKWEDDEEKDPIREELKALREEVEKLKGELTLIKEQELAKEKQEAINKIHEIMRQSLATKECCKEKPKESPEVKKGMLQLNWNHCGLEIQPDEMGYIDLTIKDGRDIVSIPLDKSHVEKLVNYLKKHFEIKD